jgi:hypothetical protein
MASRLSRNNPRGVSLDGNTVRVSTRTAMAEIITRHEAAGAGFRNELFRPAAAGLLAVVTTMDGTPVPARILKRSARPLVVVVGDDHEAAAGPAGWPQAARLLRWAHSAVLHASGGRAEEYALIAATTVACGRMLLVECELRHLSAWSALAARELPRLNLLKIVPHEGEHPIPGAPAGTVIQ